MKSEEDIIKEIDQPIYELTQNWINFKPELKEKLTFHNINLWEMVDLNFELFLREVAKNVEIGSLKQPNLKTKITYIIKPFLAKYQLTKPKFSISDINQKKILFIPNVKYDIQQIDLITQKLNSNFKPIILATSRELCKQFKKNNIEFCTIKSFTNQEIKKQVKQEQKKLNKILKSLKQDIQFQNSFEYKGIKIWSVIKDEISYIFKKHFPEIIENILIIEKLIRDKKIDAVVTCTDCHRIGRTITQTANKENIPTLLIPHGITDMRFAYIPSFAQKIAIWGEKSKEFYISYGTDESKLIITGCPRFDNLVNKKFSKEKVYDDLKLDKNKKLIIFGTHVILSSKPDKEKEIMFRSLIKIIEKIPNYQLVVKLHPADNKEFYEKIAQEMNHPEISIIKKYDLHNLLFACDLLVIKGSTIGLEALILNKLVASIHLEQCQNKTPYVNSGAVIEIYKEEEIEKAIIDALTNPELAKELETKRKKFLEVFVYKTDGRASERVAKEIEKL